MKNKSKPRLSSKSKEKVDLALAGVRESRERMKKYSPEDLRELECYARKIMNDDFAAKSFDLVQDLNCREKMLETLHLAYRFVLDQMSPTPNRLSAEEAFEMGKCLAVYWNMEP